VVRGVALALSVLALVVCVSGSKLAGQATPPDIIFHHARVITVDSLFSYAEAVAIAGGRFVAVGSNDEVLKLRAATTTVVDLRGRTIIPGLADNHLHNAGGGPGVDLSTARTLDEVYRAIQARVRTTAAGGLVVSNGDWHEAQLREQRLPLRRDLDLVAPEHPVVLVRGGHEYILNSAALRKWNIDERTREMPGGRLTRYPDGSLNGELVDRARDLVTLPVPPQRSLEERIAAQAAEYRTLHAAGLTSVRHPGIGGADYQLLAEMKRRGLLTMRVSALLRPDRELDAEAVMEWLAATHLGPEDGDERLRIGGVKLAIDGGFEGGFMRDPYAEPFGEGGTFRGLRTVPPERYTQIVKALNRGGWRVFTHAVGDAAIDQTLDAYEAADRERAIAGRRWGIEHAFIGRPDHLPRMKAMGLAISAQNHLYLAGPSLVQYWGRQRAELTTPLRMFIDAGLPVSSGTDAGVVPYPPLWTIYHFVTRDTISGGRMGLEQRITRQEALRAATIGNAWLTFEEGTKGSIEVGKVADLVVLAEDIMTVPEKRIEQMDVLRTVVGGITVYER
jgi:predicted amidohydrolase YtcJ